jgi:hypothetical protein
MDHKHPGTLRTRSNNMHLPLSLFDHGIRRIGLGYGQAIGLYDAAVEVSEEQRARAQDIEPREHNTWCLLVIRVDVGSLD